MIRTHRSIAALAIVCSVLGACSALAPRPSPTAPISSAGPADPEASVAHDEATASAEAVATVSATTPAVSPTPCCTELATPSASLTELERSDRFWRFLHHTGLFQYNFETLEEITRGVDLVVRGHVTGVYVGERLEQDDGPPAGVAWITVAIEEVLKGVVHARTEGFVEVRLFLVPPDEWESIRANVPTEEGIFFLMNERSELDRRGDPPLDPGNDRYKYFRANGYQSVIRNIDGRVEVIRPEEEALFQPDVFPYPLDGDGFEQTLERVRQVAADDG